MGCSTFLGAIYTLAGVEESFYCGEGRGYCSKGWGESAVKSPGVVKSPGGNQHTGHRAASSCLYLSLLPGLGGSLLQEALDGVQSPFLTYRLAQVSLVSAGNQLFFSDGSGQDCQLNQHLQMSWARGRAEKRESTCEHGQTWSVTLANMYDRVVVCQCWIGRSPEH